MHKGKRYTCSIVLLLLIILEWVPRRLHVEWMRTGWPPHTLIYVEPSSHSVDIINQALLVISILGLGLHLVLHSTHQILVLLVQICEMLIKVTSIRHVRRWNWLLRRLLLRLLSLGHLFFFPTIKVFSLGLLLPNHHLTLAARA